MYGMVLSVCDQVPSEGSFHTALSHTLHLPSLITHAHPCRIVSQGKLLSSARGPNVDWMSAEVHHRCNANLTTYTVKLDSTANGSTLHSAKTAPTESIDQCECIASATRMRPLKCAMLWKALQVRLNMVKPTKSSRSSTAPKSTDSTPSAARLHGNGAVNECCNARHLWNECKTVLCACTLHSE